MLRFPPADVRRPKDSIIVYSGRFSDYVDGEGHPFRPDRARTALRLINEEGFLRQPWVRIEEPVMVTKERLVMSHSPGFIDAVERANRGNRDEGMRDYLTVLGGVFRGAGDLQGAGIVDMAYRVTGEEKDAILAEIGRIVAFHE